MKKSNFRCSVLEEAQLFCVLNDISDQSFRLVVEETVCPQCRNQVHYEIVDRPVAGMHDLRGVLEHIVDGLDDVSFAQHHFVVERHQPVPHVYPYPCNQLYAVLK